MDDITVSLNGARVSAPPGTTILELAKRHNINIPTLCYLEGLLPTGACRLCVVEVEGSRTLVASCHTPIGNNMVIQTHSPKVIEARRMIIELLMASHPNNCIFCDKANQCELRLIASDLNVGLPRFRIKKYFYPVESENPYVVRDMTKCVLCRRCVRACREIKKADLFDVSYRGFKSKITVDLDQPLNKEICRDCDVCVSVCPTGALTRREAKPGERQGKVLIVKG